MLLGIDLGTGSVKALLLAEDGSVRGEGAAFYAVSTPRPGWSESEPEDWWNGTVQAVRSAAGAEEVTALGLSGQMHGVVLADDVGNPLRPAVLWADARSADQLEYYRRLDEYSRRRLANPPAAGMAGSSLLWLRDNEPEVYASARWALQPKDWLRLRLTGEVAAEPSDASATLLYDLEAGGWFYEVVEALELRPGLLAPLTGSSEVAGRLTEEAAERLGLRPGLPVAAGAADTAAAMLGAGCWNPAGSSSRWGRGGRSWLPETVPFTIPTAAPISTGPLLLHGRRAERRAGPRMGAQAIQRLLGRGLQKGLRRAARYRELYPRLYSDHRL